MKLNGYIIEQETRITGVAAAASGEEDLAYLAHLAPP